MKRLLVPACAALAILISGCTSPTTEETFAPRPPSKEVLRAEAMFNAGQIRDAVFACVDIARTNPDAAGLSELQAKIQTYLAAHRTASFETVNRTTHAGGMSDVKRYQSIPMTYGQRHHVLGETTSLKSTPTRIQEVLQTPVTVDLVNADLNAIIAEIGRAQNINIIADSGLSQGTVTIRMTDTPLVELLEYVGRNMKVAFNVGNNMIWVTAEDPAAAGGAPMETRVYRLRKGLVGSEMRPSAGPASFTASSSGGNSGSRRNSSNMGAAAAGQQQAGGSEPSTPVLIDTVTRFVPQPTGADMLWDDKTHALFIKNTRKNLELTEELIDAMDVRPIQIAIAARFMTVEQTDSRELGIDWLLSNQKGAPQTDGSGNATSGFWPKSAAGNFASGAIAGSIGSSGADFLYQTILGRTAIQAVIHALEESGRSQTLAMPRVTTLNNVEAQFRKGEDFYWFEDFDLESYSTSAGGYGNGSSSSGTRVVPSGTPTLEELGYTLTVTPSVGADLTSINLRLRPEISSFKRWEYYDIDAGATSNGSTTNAVVAGSSSIKLPIFLRSLIDTQVTVRSGETIILGGMIDSQQSVTVRGVPFLSSLPWIGGFFKTETKENKPSNLLIFVTATLINDTGEELVSLLPPTYPGLPLPPEDAIIEENVTPPAEEPAEPAA